jgi:hypothetical protein
MRKVTQNRAHQNTCFYIFVGFARNPHNIIRRSSPQEFQKYLWHRNMFKRFIYNEQQEAELRILSVRNCIYLNCWILIQIQALHMNFNLRKHYFFEQLYLFTVRRTLKI